MPIACIICASLSPLAIWLIAGGKDCPKWLKIILGILQSLLCFILFMVASEHF